MNGMRRVFAAGLVAALGLTGLSACGGETAQEENPTSITIWHYEEDNGAQGQAWARAMEIFEEQTGVKVNFEKRSFEQIRQNASQILNSDEAPDVMEYTTRATPPPACSPARACCPTSTTTSTSTAGTRRSPARSPRPAGTTSSASWAPATGTASRTTART